MKINEDGASLSSVGYGFRWIQNPQQQGDPDGTRIHDRRGYALRIHRTGNDLAWRTVGSPRPMSDNDSGVGPGDRRGSPTSGVVVIEEGPLADGLNRGLGDRGETVVVCDPRRNHLIAKDSDKDDAIDAEKLARLARGGFIKVVHHTESFDRVAFKRRVALYHDQVRHRVREANRLIWALDWNVAAAAKGPCWCVWRVTRTAR